MARRSDGRENGVKEAGRALCYFGAAPELKAMIELAAEKEKISSSAFLRRIVAQAMNYNLGVDEESGRARKYATPEERKTAAKARQHERSDLIKQLLEEHKARLKAQEEAPVA